MDYSRWRQFQKTGSKLAFLQYVQVNKFESNEVYDVTIGFFTYKQEYTYRKLVIIMNISDLSNNIVIELSNLQSLNNRYICIEKKLLSCKLNISNDLLMICLKHLESQNVLHIINLKDDIAVVQLL